MALALEGRRVLFIGGGAVAARKAAALLEAGALVTVISPNLVSDFPSPVEHLAREFREGDCAGFFIVFAATNVREVNYRVTEEAKSLGLLVNDASDPVGSDFYTQAVVRRGPLTIGISTEGDSPVVSGHLRREIEALVGPEWEALFRLMRDTQAATRYHQGGRGALWKVVLNGPVLELLRAGREEEARRELESLLGLQP